MKQTWSDGNHVELLINGEQYYPRVFEAMAEAREEILLETFIIFDDKVGQALRQSLIEAAHCFTTSLRALVTSFTRLPSSVAAAFASRSSTLAALTSSFFSAAVRTAEGLRAIFISPG